MSALTCFLLVLTILRPSGLTASEKRSDLMFLGEKAYGDGLYGLARQQWLQFIEVAEEGDDKYYAVMMVGETFFRERRLEEAAGWYGRYFDVFNPRDKAFREHFLYRYGEILFQSEDYELMEKTLFILGEEYPQGRYRDRAVFMVGEGAFRRQRYDEAAATFSSISATVGEISRLAFYRQAQSYFFMADYRKGAILFQQYVDRYPQSPLVPLAQYYLGDSLFLLEDYLAAAHAFSKVVDDYGNHELAGQAAYRSGEAFYRDGRYRDAISSMDKLLHYMPASEVAGEAFLLKSLALIELGRREEASSILKKVVASAGKGEPLLAKALYWLGILAIDGEDYQQAYGHLIRLIKEFSHSEHHEEALLHLGFASIYLNKEDEASQYLNEILRQSGDPSFLSKANYGLGELAFRSGEYEDAAKHFEASEPSMLNREVISNYIWHAAESRIRLGNLEVAEALIGKLMPLMEGKERGWLVYHLGSLLLEEGRKVEALEWFRSFSGRGTEDKRNKAVIYGLAQSLAALERSEEAETLLHEVQSKQGKDGLDRAIALELATLAEKRGDSKELENALFSWRKWPEGMEKNSARYLMARESCRQGAWLECLRLSEEILSGDSRGKVLEEKSRLLKAYSLMGLQKLEEARSVYKYLLGMTEDPEHRRLAEEGLKELEHQEDRLMKE